MSKSLRRCRIDYEPIQDSLSENDKLVFENVKEQTSERSVTVRLIDNFVKECKARSFVFFSDEPERVTGRPELKDRWKDSPGFSYGPRPTEYLLAALGSSIQARIVINACLMGIKIDAVEMTLTGIRDERGLHGMTEVRPGFREIKIEARIDSDESEENIRKLMKAAERNQVTDMLTNPLSISTQVILNGKPFKIASSQ